MKLVIQRVSKGALYVEKRLRGEIGRGLVVLVGVEEGDTEQDCEYLASKTCAMRIFENTAGRMDYSVNDIGGSIIAVSQFTLCGNCRKGNRPDFNSAEKPPRASALYEKFIELLSQKTPNVVQGDFGAYMKVEIHNDGPVTIIISSR